MRMDLTHQTSARRESNKGESLLWILGSVAAGAWAFTLGQKLFLKLQSKPTAVSIETLLLRNSGQSALLIAVVWITIVALAATVQALRSRALPKRAASVVLVTAMALRAIQLAAQGSAQVADAQILAGLMLLAAVMYWGATRIWWLVLMPLATVAMFSPLVWLEFFKGASQTVLIQALTAPAVAFALSSILIISRELRARAEDSFVEMDRVQARGLTLKKQMHGMETDLKSLLSLISISRPAILVAAPTAQPLTVGEALAPTSTLSPAPSADAGLSSDAILPQELGALGDETFLDAPSGPITTTEFVSQPVLSANASCYEEIDRLAREALDEARVKVEGKKIRLLLTAPMGASLPLSVRGEAQAVARWMKALIANSLDSVGGFPDGVVRMTLRPGLTSLMISIEDNGRGFNDDLLSKLGASQEGRMTSREIRSEVEAIGGRFEIQARLGVGSRLSIELPRLDQKPAQDKSDPRTLQAFKGIQGPNGYRPSLSSSPRA